MSNSAYEVILQQGAVDRRRPAVEPLPSPVLEVREVHQRPVRGGGSDALTRHPHPADFLNDVSQPPSLDCGEVHSHRQPAVRGTEMLIDLTFPDVGMTVIEPECCAAEAINLAADKRCLTSGAERGTDLGRV
jgi:hypothetical protein